MFVLDSFYRGTVSSPHLLELGPSLWGSESLPEHSSTISGPFDFVPSSGAWISIAASAILGVLSVLGLGYARAACEDPVVAIATAPAFGAAAVTLAATALDRMGLRLESTPVALAASVLVGLGGLAAFLVVQRQRDREAPA